MLPDISGYDVCRDISRNKNIPIIMLTARNDIVDKIRGLEIGADDYITKPFDIREVIARINVCLRRMERLKVLESNNDDIIEISTNIKINKKSRKSQSQGKLLN